MALLPIPAKNEWLRAAETLAIAAVGGAALNIRYLQRNKVPPAVAAASVDLPTPPFPVKRRIRTPDPGLRATRRAS